MKSSKKTTFGLLVANRGFFPDYLCLEGRTQMLNVLEKEGYDVVVLKPEATPFGSVETWQHARKCSDLFRNNADRIDGVIVTLPNFGDEKAIADTLRMAKLEVPVLIHAFPDNPDRMTVKDRRDSFCGKMSACNNLAQYGIPYSLTGLHTVDPSSKAFRKDLKNFAACCRVVRGLRGARIGALGARPSAFNTVRFSEKVLEANGISVDVIDLFDAFGRIGKLNDSDKRVKSKYEDLIKYVTIGEVPEEALLKMAKLGVFMDEWAAENEFDATAVQCWTAMQDYFGIVPCTVMSRLSDSLLPSACEVDITGAIGMLALTCASGKPSALLDWNNNYGDDPDRCVVWHCSNLPRSVFKEAHMSYHEIIAKTIDKDKTFGTCYGQIKAGPFTFARVSTDDLKGRIRAFVGEGEIIDQKLETFGGFGVAHIPKLQSLLRYICKNGFEHHVALNQSEVSRGLHDALSTYLCWEVYLHGQDE